MIDDEDKVLALIAGVAGAERTDHSDRTPDYWMIKNPDGVWRKWDPVNDDGDAFRLAVRLRLKVDISAVYHWGEVVAISCNRCRKFGITGYGSETLDPDPASAVRKAIVKAAVSIARKTGATNEH